MLCLCKAWAKDLAAALNAGDDPSEEPQLEYFEHNNKRVNTLLEFYVQDTDDIFLGYALSSS